MSPQEQADSTNRIVIRGGGSATFAQGQVWIPTGMNYEQALEQLKERIRKVFPNFSLHEGK